MRFLSPRTVDLIVRKLPLEGRASLHQNEVFFEVALPIGEEKAKTISDKGMIAYWPMGKALCVFIDKVRPYSAVNPVGRITENLSVFSQVKSGTKIRVERA